LFLIFFLLTLFCFTIAFGLISNKWSTIKNHDAKIM
jgi:hypothetical protein